MKYALPDTAYQVLKWIGLTVAPAAAVLIAALGSAWGWEVTPWVLTINAIGVFIGAMIGISQATAKPEQEAPSFDVPVMTEEEIAAVFDHED